MWRRVTGLFVGDFSRKRSGLETSASNYPSDAAPHLTTETSEHFHFMQKNETDKAGSIRNDVGLLRTLLAIIMAV
jgi:hypothetical protein